MDLCAVERRGCPELSEPTEGKAADLSKEARSWHVGVEARDRADAMHVQGPRAAQEFACKVIRF